MEPYVEKSKFQNPNFKSTSNFKIQISPHQLFPDWTIILDLGKSEEELLKGMKSKTRYNIRLAQKKGITVKEMTTREGFEIFWQLYDATMKRQKYFGHNYDYHKTVFGSLKNKIVRILIAYYKNTPLSAYELFLFKDGAYYPYGGSSLEYKNLMAPNLLMWETIRYAKKHGATYFDMWGASSPTASENDIYAGFTRFKEGYGGKFTQLAGSFDLVINPLLYQVYGIVYKVRNLYLSF
jgi:lipid II:glycine glycyltransferase (peptidoglycan interpeptide bridge formation enzyme)